MTRPRIHLIHALRESQAPIWEAFKAGWPDAETYNLLDDSLSADLAAAGVLTSDICDRFLILGRYAAAAGAEAILFTCSAFGPAIEKVKRDLTIPVLTPNESAFEAAAARGQRIGLLVTFPPSLAALRQELEELGQRRRQALRIEAHLVDGALSALQAGDADSHDRRIHEAIAQLPSCDAIVLGQFSMARAATGYAGPTPLFTTPGAAVAKLRGMLSRPK